MTLASRRPLIKLFKGSWHRIHQLRYGPIYFGKTPGNRFDAPAGEFGVLYAARGPHGAFAETLMHDTGTELVSESDLRLRGLARLTLSRPLRLVDLRAEGLARLGVDAILTCGPQSEYPLSRQWSKTLHDHPRRPDGIAYRSRHDPKRTCVALFERIGAALRWKPVGRSLLDAVNTPLIERIVDHYGIGLVP